MNSLQDGLRLDLFQNQYKVMEKNMFFDGLECHLLLLVCSCWFCEGELEITVAELEESNKKLAILKAQRNAAKGVGFPVLSLGNKHIGGDKIKDKAKDLQDLESTLKELTVKYCSHFFHTFVTFIIGRKAY